MDSNSKINRYSRYESIVHAVIFAGLYPNFGKTELGRKLNVLVRHRAQVLEIHKNSVNSKPTPVVDKRWAVYGEKFGTSNKVTVSVTCFVHAFALLFFGGEITIEHLKRQAVIDGWAEIGVPAKTGVTILKLREEFDKLMQSYLDLTNTVQSTNSMIGGVSEILAKV